MRRYRSKPVADASVTEAALDAIDADRLRTLVREMLPWFDEALHARFVNALVDQAARNGSGWVPPEPTDAIVEEVEAFAEAAMRVGSAEPAEVDAYLRQGANAFLAKNYTAALQIFRALLIPVGDAEIDLGQHEMIDEVLGIDAATCATQYAVSVYMTATPTNRGREVLAAIDEMRSIAHLWEPLRKLEHEAIEPYLTSTIFLCSGTLLSKNVSRKAAKAIGTRTRIVGGARSSSAREAQRPVAGFVQHPKDTAWTRKKSTAGVPRTRASATSAAPYAPCGFRRGDQASEKGQGARLVQPRPSRSSAVSAIRPPRRSSCAHRPRSAGDGRRVDAYRGREAPCRRH